MTINEVLEEICKKGSEYNEIIENLLAPNLHLKDELISEITISYLTNKEKVQQVIDEGYFKYYFIMTVKNQVHSSTSPFHKNIRIKDNISSDEIQLENLIDEYGLEYKQEMDDKYYEANMIRKNIKMSFFESEMMRLYFDENMTYRAIAEEYDINHTLIFKTIKSVIERMKKQIK